MLRLTSIKLNNLTASTSPRIFRQLDRTLFTRKNTLAHILLPYKSSSIAISHKSHGHIRNISSVNNYVRPYLSQDSAEALEAFPTYFNENVNMNDLDRCFSLAINEHPFEVAFIFIVTLLSYWGAYELYINKHPDSGVYGALAFVPFFTNLITLDLADMSPMWILVYTLPAICLLLPPVASRPFISPMITLALSLYTTYNILKNYGYNTYFGLIAYSLRWTKPILYPQLDLTLQFNQSEERESPKRVSELCNESFQVMEAWNQITGENPYNAAFVEKYLPKEAEFIQNNPQAKIGFYAKNTGLEPPCYIKTYFLICDLMTPIIPIASQLLKWAEYSIYGSQ